MKKKIKQFINELFAPRITYKCYCGRCKDIPPLKHEEISKEFDEISKHMDNIFKKL